jgi:hypothetical protein
MADPLITNESVCIGLGIDYPIVDDTLNAMVDQMIEATEGKVELFLNRSLTAKMVTVPALTADDRYDLTTIDAWPEANQMFDDRYRVSSKVANTDDPSMWDVTFAVGLDVVNDPDLRAILYFIREDTVTALANNPRFKLVDRLVSSVSADGQSISYAQAQTGRSARIANSAIAGANITIADLKKWKRIPISQRHMPRTPPWPYATGYGR